MWFNYSYAIYRIVIIIVKLLCFCWVIFNFMDFRFINVFSTNEV